MIGVDYDAQTAIDAGREWEPQGLRFAAMDGARIAAPGALDRLGVLVAHHRALPAPEQHVAELARVATDDGTALVITPNRPADFENPFHLSLFEADELESLLALFFHDVAVQGLEGSPELHADFAQRRASGEQLLRLDPLDIRHKIPYSWYVWAYERVLPVVYKVLGSERTGIGSGLDAVALLRHRPDHADDTRPVRGGEQPAADPYFAQRPRESGRSASSAGSGSTPVDDLLRAGATTMVDDRSHPSSVKCTPSPRTLQPLIASANLPSGDDEPVEVDHRVATRVVWRGSRGTAS